ncbi:MAG: Ig-like domain-containing protein [Candidatus Saccharibacteria bacterium]|nr:Ig-like domain-containing protein [Candidatus Saccharibacteria bacterium]
MRKTKKIISLFLVILAVYGMKVIFSSFKNVPFSSKPNYIASAASTTANAISYNAEDICNAVKTNKTIRVGIYSYYDNKSYYMSSSTNACNNSATFNSRINQIKKGESFVKFGRAAKANNIYIDDAIVKSANAYGNYAYFNISNKPRPATVSKATETLKPGETPFIQLDISDKNIKGNTYSSPRLLITYGRFASDTDITTLNSMAYYVYTNKKTYGPYPLARSEFKNTYSEQNATTGNYPTLMVYKLTSSKLNGNFDSASEKINAIRIYPYYNYPIQKGSFKIFNISLEEFKSNKSYVTVSGAEDKIRHNIVNNMMENATVKWNVIGNTTLHFYHHYITEPIILKPNSKKNYYGIPYVNTPDTTVEQFTHEGVVNNKTTAKKNNTAYFSYIFTDKYLTNTVSNHNKTIKAGSAIPGNILYVNEKNEANDKKGTRKAELTNKNLHFVSNSAPYYYLGIDCSASVYLAVGREIATTNSMAGSSRYFDNNQVSMLGGLSISMRKVELNLRSNNTLKKTQSMTRDLYEANYSKYLKTTYSEQKIYNSYALAVPGDIIDKYGHVRIISGKTHVVCKNGNKSTDNYTPGFCNNNGGINPTKSYVITTEVGTYYTKVYNRDSTHIASSKTGWKYTLNSSLTDLSSVDDLYDSSKKLDSIFKVNLKYTFKNLYNSDYYAFRYKDITNNISANKVEKPAAKYILDKTYSNYNQTIYDYMANNKKLKGIISTNYLIDAVKFDINGTKYYVYPAQTEQFSLYKDISNASVLNAIKGLNYKKKNAIKISVKFGPNIAAVRTAAGADSEGYIKVIDTSGLTANIIVPTTGIKLNHTSATIYTNDTVTLTSTITPSNATNKNVTWTSSNTNVATVSSAGVVKGVANGTAIITVKTKDTSKAATATITVKTHVSSVKLHKTATTINKGKTEKVSVEVLPATASDKTLTWSSNNTKIATVDTNGAITAKATGTAIITVKTTDGAKTATIKVTVVIPTVHVTKVQLSKTATSLVIGSTEKITATVSPSNATNKSVTWQSNNTAIAKIDSAGTITAVGVGTATITAITSDSAKKATIKVVVTPIKVQSVKFDKTNISMEVGNTDKITATITPSNATDKKLTWSSSNVAIVAVDQYGNLLAKSAGSATIAVITNDGNKVATAKVIVDAVEEPVVNTPEEDEKSEPEDDDLNTILTTSVKINQSDMTIKAGQTINLTATVLPNNATNKNLDWTSSNTNVATVSSTGAIQGVSKGTATITASTRDTSKTAKITIKVTGSSSGQSGRGNSGSNNGGGNNNQGNNNPSTPTSDNTNPGGEGDNPINENHSDPELISDDLSTEELDSANAMSIVIRNVAIAFVSVVVVGGGILFIANRKIH